MAAWVRYATSVFVALGLLMPSASLLGVSAQESKLVVIVHPSNPTKALSALELRALFRSNRRFWPNGRTIVAFNAPPRTPHRILFDRVVLDMSPDEAGRFWVDRQVRGGARPPRLARSTRLAQAAVRRLANAVAYVPADGCPQGVRVVAVIANGRVLRPSIMDRQCKHE